MTDDVESAGRSRPGRSSRSRLLLGVPLTNAAALVAGIWFGPGGYAADRGRDLTSGLTVLAWNLLPVLVLAGLLGVLVRHGRRSSTVVVLVASILFSALTAWAVVGVFRDPSGLAGLAFVFLPLPQLLVLAVAATLAVLLRLRRRPEPPAAWVDPHPPSVFSRSV